METYKNLCESVEIWGAENNRLLEDTTTYVHLRNLFPTVSSSAPAHAASEKTIMAARTAAAILFIFPPVAP